MAWWYDMSVGWEGEWDLVFAEAENAEAADEALSEESPELLSAGGPRGPFATRAEAERAAADEQESDGN